MMLHSVSRKVLDNVLGSQRSYLCFLDCVVFVSITLLELFDHSFTNIDGIMGLVKELHDIATASVAIKSLHFPLDQEDPVEFDVHQKDLDENDVNSVDENTAAPFASVEDITDDQEIFDNDYIEGANESSDHEAELQFYPPTVASYAASQDSDDSEWSLVTAPESDALDDGSDQYMN